MSDLNGALGNGVCLLPVGHAVGVYDASVLLHSDVADQLQHQRTALAGVRNRICVAPTLVSTQQMFSFGCLIGFAGPGIWKVGIRHDFIH